MHEATYLEFARNPLELEARLASLPKEVPSPRIFIDEIQRLPSLLNTIQVILDAAGNRIRFLLTGSSARKLRRGEANLLPGRIHTFRLGPLVASELDYEMNTQEALRHGTLPGIYTDPDEAEKQKTLRSYAGTYLKEEIQAENLSRNLEGFARMLQVTAGWSGNFLDLAKMASAALIPRQTALRYFEVMEDSLILVRVPPFSKSATRRIVQHPRFFFFDTGVLNGLLSNFEASADRSGMLFEHLIHNQLVSSAAACDREMRISSYRTEHGAEVDSVVELGGESFAIEVKAARHISRVDSRGFRSFEDYLGKRARSMIFYAGKDKKEIDGIRILPWQEGLREIGL